MDKVYLDIGTEALKIYHSNRCSVIYFKETTLFDKKKKLLKELEKFNQADVVLTGDIIESQVRSFFYQREKPDKSISKRENNLILKKIEESFLPSGCSFKKIKILEYKIQGYKVDHLIGYQGKGIEIKFLMSFSKETALLEKIFKNLEIFSLPEIIPYPDHDCFIIDIGGEVTRIFEIEQGVLNNISQVEVGGKFFSKILAGKLNISLKDARVLKERYSNGELTPSAQKKVKELFQEQNFQENFNSFLKPTYLFGGGSLLPEASSIFKGSFLWQLKKFDNMLKGNRKRQCFSCFLLTNYGKKIF